jgi:hypothetical protein
MFGLNTDRHVGPNAERPQNSESGSGQSGGRYGSLLNGRWLQRRWSEITIFCCAVYIRPAGSVGLLYGQLHHTAPYHYISSASRSIFPLFELLRAIT